MTSSIAFYSMDQTKMWSSEGTFTSSDSDSDAESQPETPGNFASVSSFGTCSTKSTTPCSRSGTKPSCRVMPPPLVACNEQDQDLSPSRRRRASRRGSLKLRLDLALEASDHLDRLESGQTGGVYQVPEASSPNQQPLAVFKPENEEGFERRGIPSGKGAVREEAAYMLDRLVGSAVGVP